MTGIEPTSSGWKPDVLPLNHIRLKCVGPGGSVLILFRGFGTSFPGPCLKVLDFSVPLLRWHSSTYAGMFRPLVMVGGRWHGVTVFQDGGHFSCCVGLAGGGSIFQVTASDLFCQIPPEGSNCSRLMGRHWLAKQIRAWLPLCKRPNSPQVPASLNSYGGEMSGDSPTGWSYCHQCDACGWFGATGRGIFALALRVG